MHKIMRLSFPFSWLALVLIALLFACSNQTRPPVDAHPSASVNAQPTTEAPSAGNIPLKTVADIPLSGGTTRLDYQSLDSGNGRLYIAHLGSDLMTVFDVNRDVAAHSLLNMRGVMETGMDVHYK